MRIDSSRTTNFFRQFVDQVCPFIIIGGAGYCFRNFHGHTNLYRDALAGAKWSVIPMGLVLAYTPLKIRKMTREDKQHLRKIYAKQESAGLQLLSHSVKVAFIVALDRYIVAPVGGALFRGVDRLAPTLAQCELWGVRGYTWLVSLIMPAGFLSGQIEAAIFFTDTTDE